MPKTCRDCKENKPVYEFYKDKRVKGGRGTYCKPCHGIRMAKNYLEIRHTVLKTYGWKCACCGEDRYEFLSLDHVGGGGNQERRLISNVYRQAIKENFPDKYRLLCHNCNMSLGFYGHCPHEAE